MSKKRLQEAIQVGKDIGEDENSCSAKSFTKLIEVASLKFDQQRDGVFSLQYSSDAQKLAVGYGDGAIEVFSNSTLPESSSKLELKKGKHGGLPITCLRYVTGADLFLAGSSDGSIYGCDLKDNSCPTVAEELDNEINCLDVSRSQYRFATAGKDLTVRIYDIATRTIVNEYIGYKHKSGASNQSGHASRIFALRYFPDQEYILVTGGWDNHLKIWDTRTSDGVIRTISGPHICGDSIDIKGSTLLTGSWVAKDAVQLWDIGSCSLIETIPVASKPEGQFIYSCKICDSGAILFAGSGTQSVQAFDTVAHKSIGELMLGKPVQALDIGKGGEFMVFGGSGTNLKFGSLK